MDPQPGMAVQTGYDAIHVPGYSMPQYGLEQAGDGEYSPPSNYAWNEQHTGNFNYASTFPSGSQYAALPVIDTDQNASRLPLVPNYDPNAASPAWSLPDAESTNSAMGHPVVQQSPGTEMLSNDDSPAVVMDHQSSHDRLQKLEARINEISQKQVDCPLLDYTDNDLAFRKAIAAYLNDLKQRLTVDIDTIMQGTVTYRFQKRSLAFDPSVEKLLQALQNGQVVMFVIWDVEKQSFSVRLPYSIAGSMFDLDEMELWKHLVTPYYVASFLTLDGPIGYNAILKLALDAASILQEISIRFRKEIAERGYLAE
ncbi:hypothetical protein H4R35_006667 [Dimargaris xerosporica]|nr:hypothetical protein H4R35_006667 [Dimargaris xerosporica]